MTKELLNRTKRLGIDTIFIVDLLPNKTSGWIIGRQIIRSATSVGANYRATRLAKSDADFINKLKIEEEECDETLYWIEIIEDTHMITIDKMSALKKEAKEILAIIIASLKTLRNKKLIQN